MTPDRTYNTFTCGEGLDCSENLLVQLLGPVLKVRQEAYHYGPRRPVEYPEDDQIKGHLELV